MVVRQRHCLCHSKKGYILCKYLDQIWNGVEQRSPSSVDSADNIGISDLYILRNLAFKILFVFCTPPTGILRLSKVIPDVFGFAVQEYNSRWWTKTTVDTTPMSCLYSWRLCVSKLGWKAVVITDLLFAPSVLHRLWRSTGTDTWNNVIFPQTGHSIAAFWRVHCSDGARGCQELHHGKSWSFRCIFFEINSIKDESALRPTNLWYVPLVLPICSISKVVGTSVKRLNPEVTVATLY